MGRAADLSTNFVLTVSSGGMGKWLLAAKGWTDERASLYGDVFVINTDLYP